MASNDSFLKLDGIPGESMDAKHKDEIQLVGWRWGASQTGKMHEGGGGGAGKVKVHDLVCEMHLSKASPKLIHLVCTGQHIKHAFLSTRKAGKDQQDYLRIALFDVLVSRIEQGQGLHQEENDLPVDSVSLHFAKYQIEYFPQKADGSLGAATQVKYDLKAMSHA